jgi:uncharacterized protein (DUF983 family)
VSAALDHLGAAYWRDGFTPNFVVNGAKVMFVHAPFTAVAGTVCPNCKGAKQVEGYEGKVRDCYYCNGDGLDHNGKDWGKVLAALIGE